MELDNQCEHGQSDIVTKIVYIHVSYDITDAVLLLKVVSTSFPFFLSFKWLVLGNGMQKRI